MDTPVGDFDLGLCGENGSPHAPPSNAWFAEGDCLKAAEVPPAPNRKVVCA